MYIWYFWQGNHHTYGHIRCVCTVLANPNYNATTRLCSLLVCLHYAFAFCQCTCWQAYVHAPTACVLALHSVLSVHVLAGLCVRTHCLRACITQCFVCICAGRLVRTHSLLYLTLLTITPPTTHHAPTTRMPPQPCTPVRLDVIPSSLVS